MVGIALLFDCSTDTLKIISPPLHVKILRQKEMKYIFKKKVYKKKEKHSFHLCFNWATAKRWSSPKSGLYIHGMKGCGRWKEGKEARGDNSEKGWVAESLRWQRAESVLLHSHQAVYFNTQTLNAQTISQEQQLLYGGNNLTYVRASTQTWLTESNCHSSLRLCYHTAHMHAS